MGDGLPVTYSLLKRNIAAQIRFEIRRAIEVPTERDIPTSYLKCFPLTPPSLAYP